MAFVHFLSDLHKINIGIFNILDRIQAYRTKWERHLERNDTDPHLCRCRIVERTKEVQKITVAGLHNYFKLQHGIHMKTLA
jgi:hypothetical protein